MLGLAVSVAILWPQHCTTMGDVFNAAARIRDLGQPLAAVQKLTTDKEIRRVLTIVYSKPEMTAEQWRWFAVGMCTGMDQNQEPMSPTRRSPYRVTTMTAI